MRYLAELAWAPYAILRNPQLRWRTESTNTLVVGAGSAEAEAQVWLTLDNEGRIQNAYAPDRPRAIKGGAFALTPWRGTFSD